MAAVRFSNPPSGLISKGNENKLSKRCLNSYVYAPFTIAKLCKQPKCPSTDECFIYTHSGTLFNHEKKKILPFATTWIELEDTILSEITQRKANAV